MQIWESPWFKKLLRTAPVDAFGLVAESEGLSADLFDHARELFSAVQRIEFCPIGTKKDPGWKLILDHKLSLWFYQQGDTYRFDGWEIGDYSDWPERKNPD